MTEGRSTGIKKIIEAMAENGSPKPHFEFDEEHTYFQVTLPIHEAVKHQMTLAGGTPAETGGTPAEQNIIVLEYIRKHGFIKRENVEQLLQVKDSRAREILKKMADSGQVIKVGTGKNTCYKEVN